MVGTIIEGLKPLLAKELKLKQSWRLPEAIRMAKILDATYYTKRRLVKENIESEFFNTLQTKTPWKEKEVDEGSTKKKSKEVRKLFREEVQVRMSKGFCFK